MRKLAAALLTLVLLTVSADERSYPFVTAAELEQLQAHFGEPARLRGEELNGLLTQLRRAPEDVKLREINRYFNQFDYVPDMEQWGKQDYWETPVEFLGTNAGDCEDFVVAKYFALRALGVEQRKLYLTYVKATRENVAHMVLSYYSTPTSVPLVLDNYDPFIRPATERGDLIPVYSFNGQSLFLAGSDGARKAMPTDQVRNSKWDDLLARIRGKQP